MKKTACFIGMHRPSSEIIAISFGDCARFMFGNRPRVERKTSGKMGSWAALTITLLAAPAMSQAAGDASKGTLDKVAVVRHDRVQPIDLDCSKRLVPKARTKGEQSSTGLNQEALLLAAVKGKPFPKTPLQSLGWMEMALKAYGFQGSLTTLQGPSQMAAMRLSSLVDNDYTVAAQMAYGIHLRDGMIPKPHSEYLGRLIMSLTESSHETPETTHTNTLIEQASALISNASPSVKAYGRWAIRGYAYDDTIAIDAALSGVCMSDPTATELATLKKAIRVAQFDPKRDYTKSISVR